MELAAPNAQPPSSSASAPATAPDDGPPPAPAPPATSQPPPAATSAPAAAFELNLETAAAAGTATSATAAPPLKLNGAPPPTPLTRDTSTLGRLMMKTETAAHPAIPMFFFTLDGDISLNILEDEFGYTLEIPDPVAYLESQGMTVSFLTAEEVQAFKEATWPVYAKWVPNIGEELFEKARADMAKGIK